MCTPPLLQLPAAAPLLSGRRLAGSLPPGVPAAQPPKPRPATPPPLRLPPQVITGVGRHSAGNQPRVLPAVVRYLSEAGYKFDSALDNPGVVLVQIGV